MYDRKNAYKAMARRKWALVSENKNLCLYLNTRKTKANII